MNLEVVIPADAILERFNSKRLQEISDDLVGIEIFRVKKEGVTICYAVRYLQDNESIEVFETMRELLDHVRPEDK